MKLSQKVLEVLRTNEMIGALITATGKSYSTINRWIEKDNSKIIDSRICINVIKEKTGFSEEEIFETLAIAK